MNRTAAVSLMLVLLILAACERKNNAANESRDTSNGARRIASENDQPGQHEHQAPHGGTAIELGEEAFHIELVLDASEGRLDAYILDGEMETFVRSAMPQFEAEVLHDGVKDRLTFLAVTDSATGERVGDTSLFSAKAAWLSTADRFEGTILNVNIKGATFDNVSFVFQRRR